jgi:hypothetical protein
MRQLTTRPPLAPIVIIILLVLVGGASVGYLTYKKYTNMPQPATPTQQSGPTVNLDKPTNEEIDTGRKVKQDTINSAKNTDSQQPSDDPLTITLSDIGDVLRIRTRLTTVTSEGSCDLTLSNGQQTLVQASVGLQPLSNYTTCKGWDIPVDTLSSGKWTTTVTAHITSTTYTATSDITIP